MASYGKEERLKALREPGIEIQPGSGKKSAKPQNSLCHLNVLRPAVERAWSAPSSVFAARTLFHRELYVTSLTAPSRLPQQDHMITPQLLALLHYHYNKFIKTSQKHLRKHFDHLHKQTQWIRLRTSRARPLERADQAATPAALAERMTTLTRVCLAIQVFHLSSHVDGVAGMDQVEKSTGTQKYGKYNEQVS